MVVRALGIDPGSKRIGLALSDEDRTLASPLETVAGPDKASALARVVEVARAHEVTDVVVGLPLRLDGTEGPEASRARRLGDAVAAALPGVRVTYWDERFTTAQAERALSAAGKRGAARRAVVDQAAAAVLLQSWLDADSEARR